MGHLLNALPVVERELRVASRRSQTWWLRCGMAAAALGLGLMVYASQFTGPAARGRAVYVVVSLLMLLLAGLSGVFLTADAISSERRGGTLGLLFLTPLRPRDVLLGKLTSSGLSMLYGLLAVFPLLFLPVLMGGVTGAETARLCVGIVMALSLSLVIGLWVSVQSRDSTRAALTTLTVLVALTLTPLLIETAARLARLPSFSTSLLMGVSPVFTWRYAGEAYQVGPAGTVFWRSIGLQALLATGLLISTCRRLAQHWRESPPDAPPARSRARPHHRPRLSDFTNPFGWLMRHQMTGSGWTSTLRVGVALVLLCVLLAMFLSAGFLSGALFMMCFACLFTLHVLLAIELSLEATRPLLEQHQSGALEQLLTSPLQPWHIVTGSALALDARFKGKVVRTFALNVAAWFVMVAATGNRGVRGEEFWLLSAFLLGGGLVSVLNFTALKWVGLMRALIDKTPLRAAMRTLLIVHALPWLLFMLLFFALTHGRAGTAAAGFSFGYVGWIVFSVWLGQRARRHLFAHFRALAVAHR